MPLARSRVLPEIAASEALNATYGLWAPALTQAQEAAQEATLAAARHWRALAELQISAADEAYRLASAHVERRQEALAQMLESLWPALAATQSEKEAARG